MKNKTKRLNAIREIITDSPVGSQDELLRLLLERGYDLTQATLSRDLKELKVAKTPDMSGSYVYRLTPQEKGTEDWSDAFAVTRNRFRSIDFSGNIAVLHTRPGYASSVAYDIDDQARDVIIGTVAGEDTIIAVMKEGVTREEVMKSFSIFIPEILK